MLLCVCVWIHRYLCFMRWCILPCCTHCSSISWQQPRSFSTLSCRCSFSKESCSTSALYTHIRHTHKHTQHYLLYEQCMRVPRSLLCCLRLNWIMWPANWELQQTELLFGDLGQLDSILYLAGRDRFNFTFGLKTINVQKEIQWRITAKHTERRKIHSMISALGKGWWMPMDAKR